jgi:hypothetical protein
MPPSRVVLAPIVTGIAVALALGVAGCGSDPGDDSAPENPQAAGPLVVYEKTGGVAGVRERLEVRGDGAALLSVGYQPPVIRRFELDESDLDRLRELLAEADFAGVDPGPGIGCADCFQYEIEYEGTTTAFAEIAGIPDSVGELVTELGGIVEAHSPAQPAPG